MKKRIYIETTVISYYVARPSRDLLIAGHQEATHELWPRLSDAFESFISALVYEEARKGDAEQANKRLASIKSFQMLAVDDKAMQLAQEIVRLRGIPEQYPEDALHLAIAAVNGIDLVLTWNFAHLNNPFTRMKVRRIIEQCGYRYPEVTSPEELLEVELC
jgi:predicted nucleic acid-binding protein